MRQVNKWLSEHGAVLVEMIVAQLRCIGQETVASQVADIGASLLDAVSADREEQEQKRQLRQDREAIETMATDLLGNGAADSAEDALLLARALRAGSKASISFGAS